MSNLKKIMIYSIGCVSIFFHFSVYALTEWELQRLEGVYWQPFSEAPLHLSLSLPPLSGSKKAAPPLSMEEYRSRLKKHFTLQLHPKWQIGLDSFKVCAFEKPIVAWPAATQPKGAKTRSQKGYGVGIKMNLD